MMIDGGDFFGRRNKRGDGQVGRLKKARVVTR